MPDETEDDDKHTAIDHAADAPTAVWDSESLRAAGVDLPEDEGKPTGSAAPQIQTVSGAGAGARRAGLSWTLTIVLAVVLGLAVYFAVRLIR